MLREFAAAKVNLCLHVTGRRPDGLHVLDSIAAFAGPGDTLTAEPADNFSLTLSGPFGGSLDAGADNLVLRAARALAARLDRPRGARLELHKCLPVASGIGGGSADAAAALRVLARLWEVSPEVQDALPEIALSLGADVPVCLNSHTSRMQGIGEILTPLALPPCAILLVNPGVAVPTGSVFAALRAERGTIFSDDLNMATWPDAAGLAQWLRDATRNDLETYARRMCPQIGEVVHAIARTEGCLLARMSGSGATCFGLYSTQSQADRAKWVLRRPDWWCKC